MGKPAKSTKRFMKAGKVKDEQAKRRAAKKNKKSSSDRGHRRRAEGEATRALNESTTGRNLAKKRRAPADADSAESSAKTGMGDVAGLNVDDFMSEQFLQSSDDESEDEDRKIKANPSKRQRVTAKGGQKSSKKKKGGDDDDDDDDDGSSGSSGSGSSGSGSSGSSGSGSDDDDMDMEALKAQDPEFAKYLAENDPSAMKFDAKGSDDKEDMDEEEDSEGEGEGDEDGANGVAEGASNTEVLTSTKLASLTLSSFGEGHSMGGLRDIVRAFAAATHMTDVDSKVASSYHYVITSSEVYNDLMMTCVTQLAGAFQHHLPTKASALPSSSPKWPKLQVLVKSFLKNLLHLMLGVTDSEMLVMLMNSIQTYVPYIASIPNLPKRYLKELLSTWSTTGKSELRTSCFLSIRQLALVTPFPFIEQVMKGVYLSFVRNAKTMNEQSRTAVAMMGKCIVEILGIDLVAAYQHAFVYIRQLAIHLRNAIKNKSKDAYAAVFNWQYMNCLMVWAAVISTYPKENQLQPLMYPLVQIIIGTVNLVPAARYFPMRFHCVELLNKLSAATGGTLIPIPSLLLDVLRCPEFGKSSPSTRKPPMMEYIVKVSTKELQTKSYQESCISKALELLENHFSIHKWSISYPELAHSTVAALRKFSRDSQVARWRQQCKAVMVRIQKQTTLVESRRNNATFGPKDLESAKNFMSKEADAAHQRFLHEQAEQEEKTTKKSAAAVVAAAAARSKSSKKKKKGSGKDSGKKNNEEQGDDEEVEDMGGGFQQSDDDDDDDRVEDLVLSDSD